MASISSEGSQDLSGSRDRVDGADLALGPAKRLRRPTDAGPERIAYSVDEAAAVLGIARETIYELIRTGQLRSRKAGSRRIIGRHHLLEFLDNESESDRYTVRPLH
jgi:excisionase family DNA binding protein